VIIYQITPMIYILEQASQRHVRKIIRARLPTLGHWKPSNACNAGKEKRLFEHKRSCQRNVDSVGLSGLLFVFDLDVNVELKL